MIASARFERDIRMPMGTPREIESRVETVMIRMALSHTPKYPMSTNATITPSVNSQYRVPAPGPRNYRGGMPQSNDPPWNYRLDATYRPA